MIRIKGESTGPRGSIEITDLKAQGEFTLPLANLNTGIEMRDEHMKQKYLEVAKNPDAVLKITNLTLTSAEKGQDVPFSGTLTLHGTTKNVDGHVNYQTASGTKKTHADFKIRLSDFGIAIPAYAGLKVADEVQVQVDVNLRAE